MDRWRDRERVAKCRRWEYVLVVEGEEVEEKKGISAWTLGAGAGAGGIWAWSSKC